MKFLDYSGLQRFLNKLKAIIPTKTSDITNDSGYLDTTGVQNYMENGGGYSQSYIDTALSGKASASHTHSKTDLTDLFSSANTWTAQNSYNSDLNLNYASTDVDDIVNSVAGSATLDNFVHLTGNETVNGIKSFPDGVIANVTGSATSATNDGSGNVISSTYGKLGANNTWSGINTFNRSIILASDFTLGVIPQSIQSMSVAFKNSTEPSQDIRFIIDTAGETYTSFRVCNKFTSGALSPTGSIYISELKIGVSSGGEKYIWANGLWQNNINPYANNTYNLGTSTNQWKSVYSQTYYYNGTEFQNKFVTLDSVQTITYSKTFGSDAFLDVHGYRFRVINDDMEVGVVPTSNQWTGMLFTDKNKTNISEIVQSYQKSGNTFWQVIITPNETNAQRRNILNYVYHPTNNVNYLMIFEDLVPSASNTYHLGTSTSKWKSFNGINPGALSLPDNSNVISIDTTNWDLTNYSANSYTPPADGWIFFGGNADGMQIDGTINYGITVTKGYGGFCEAFLPVFKDKRLQCRFRNCTLLKSAVFYPCLGNV